MAARKCEAQGHKGAADFDDAGGFWIFKLADGIPIKIANFTNGMVICPACYAGLDLSSSPMALTLKGALKPG